MLRSGKSDVHSGVGSCGMEPGMVLLKKLCGKRMVPRMDVSPEPNKNISSNGKSAKLTVAMLILMSILFPLQADGLVCKAVPNHVFKAAGRSTNAVDVPVNAFRQASLYGCGLQTA